MIPICHHQSSCATVTPDPLHFSGSIQEPAHCFQIPWYIVQTLSDVVEVIPRRLEVRRSHPPNLCMWGKRWGHLPKEMYFFNLQLLILLDLCCPLEIKITKLVCVHFTEKSLMAFHLECSLYGFKSSTEINIKVNPLYIH